VTEAEAQATSDDFALVNHEDEAEILAELRGAPADKFVYRNARGQWELTYAGTKWAVRKMAEKGETIRIDQHPKVERCVIDPEYITVTVLAKRVMVDKDTKVETILDTTIGSARNWIKQKMKDGSIHADDFFFSKCVSRATRNSQQSLLPQDFKKEVIDALVKMHGGGAPPAKPAPKGAAKPPAKAAPAAPPAAQAPAGAKPAPTPPPPAQNAPAAPPASPAAQAVSQKAAAPAKAAPPARPAAAAPASPPAAAAKPPAPASPPTKPAVPNTTKPAPGQSPKGAAQDVLAQRFAVVLKQAAGTTDHQVALKFLESVTGKKSISELSKEEIMELGPLMNGIAKGALLFAEGAIRDIVTGEISWPRQPEQAEAPADPVPAEAAQDPEPPAAGSEEMF
jgi:hypothetical protein